jgi:hypothetical protein
MNTKPLQPKTSTYYSVSEVAWILGVRTSTVCRAIRTGAQPAVRRRSQLVVPVAVLRRMLGGAP